ncbi:hypothetical protein JTB14_033223 [Gonioctena quinquepunctata]|nr:hypothetical protein JTB14_033223 [Gonioctena quinquepunctata]
MPRTEFISFSHFNVRSLLTGFDMFSDFMQEECLDICSISETWLNQSFPSRAISVPDYNLIRKDRQGKKGGGLAFYIKKSIKYKIVDDVESFNEYKDLRNFANRCIEAEKKAFLQHTFKSDPKLFWKSLKSSNILKKSHGYDIDIDPSAFNDHFLNSVPDLHPTDNNILSKYDGIYPELKGETFSLNPVTNDEVEQTLRRIKTQAKGSDDINLRMLEIVFSTLTPF